MACGCPSSELSFPILLFLAEFLRSCLVLGKERTCNRDTDKDAWLNGPLEERLVPQQAIYDGSEVEAFFSPKHGVPSLKGLQEKEGFGIVRERA